MLWHQTVYFTLIAALLFGLPSSAKAQNESYSQIAVKDSSVIGPGQPTSVDDSYGYERRALRFESQFGRTKIIEGIDGPVVGTAEPFRRLDLASLVRSSDSAVAAAATFNRNRRAGEWGFALGFAVFAFEAIFLKVTGGPHPASLVTGLGATALMFYGADRLGKASESLSKSLWLYNRDLKK